jgi:hypothetical protein
VMSVLESALILVATLSALWWAFARHRAPVALERLSLAGLGLGVLAVALEGVHWQLVPWQLLALACAAVALLRRQRLARSRRVVRVVGRAALVLGILAGGMGLLFARVPQLQPPSGRSWWAASSYTGPTRSGPRPSPPAPGSGAWSSRRRGTRWRRRGRRCPTSKTRGACPPTWTPTPPGSTATSTRWTRTPPPRRRSAPSARPGPCWCSSGRAR